MTVVFDTNTIASAVFWPASTARRALAGAARRRFRFAVTADILEEYAATCAALHARRPKQDPAGPLAWIRSGAVHVEPAALGKQRSRDPADDIFLACALAAKAEYIVSNDRDLLVLEKPFGIRTVTPVEFLRILKELEQQH
jgi:putative PIN family toxin of toxin-antitoxin system